MSIIVDKNTRVIVQGITGNEGLFHTRQMVQYGTKIVGGMTPGKGGQSVDGIPVFNTVASAVKETGANASVIFVPPAFSADAVMEAVDAGLKTIICMTEGIPTLDMIQAKQYLKGKNINLIGPNTPGIISPEKCKIGVMAGYIHKEGSIGVISRSVDLGSPPALALAVIPSSDWILSICWRCSKRTRGLKQLFSLGRSVELPRKRLRSIIRRT